MMQVAINLNPDLDNIFFMVIEILALVWVVVIAIRWRPVTITLTSPVSAAE
jgi:hypothetical protein